MTFLTINPNSSGKSDYHPDATDASIRAAASIANAAGGGTVFIPVGRIIMASALLFYSGVAYQGQGWQADFGGTGNTSLGGTTLVGDGTFNGIEYNPTDGAVQPTVYATFVAGMISGPQARDITFENFAYGIKAGSLYNPAFKYGWFERLNFINCQQWGFWVENEIESTFKQITCLHCQAGGIARICSGGTALYSGNSRWEASYVQTPVTGLTSYTSRGICTWARGGNTVHNDQTTIGEQVNRGAGPEITQAATMVNLSASIAVVDGTYFPVDMPVVFDATQNGFVGLTQTYFVATNDGSNNITVAKSMRGCVAAEGVVTATGAVAVNIKTRGMPHLECAGLSSTDFIYGATLTAIDLEGFGSVVIFKQNTLFTRFQCSFVMAPTTTNYFTFCLRNSKFGYLSNWCQTNFDGDNLSWLNNFDGQRIIGSEKAANAGDNRFVGLGGNVIMTSGVRSKPGSLALYMNGYDIPDLTINNATNGLDVPHGIAFLQNYFTNGVNLNPQAGSTAIYNTAGVGGATLPVITVNNAGFLFFVSNPQASICTLTCSGTATFNNAAGVTTFAMPPNSGVTLQAGYTGGGSFYWSVLGKT